jgi:WD40 repeat protein/class 3 adenylate cyclase
MSPMGRGDKSVGAMRPPHGEGDSPAERGVAIRTFLIADIRGYTRFTQERGDEAAARLATRFAEIVQEGVEAGGGELVELRGDEALAVFASARRAIRTAVELQEVLGGELGEGPSFPLGVGIGLDAGEAVPVADGYRGGALNLAARLCARAGPGEVLASQGVIHLAKTLEGIRLEPLEPLALKGLAQPVPAVRVAADRHAEQPARPPPAHRAELPSELDPVAPLVGRERELRWLRWGWRQARRGHGRVMFVTGPSGIGKTRLAAELAKEVHVSGWPVAYARCAGPASVALEVLRQDRPAATLLVADDVDLAGGTVLDALEALVEGVAGSPMMVLGTCRDDIGSPLVSARFERAAGSEAARRRLGPLDAEGVRQIASLYLRRAAPGLPVEAVLEQTDGVPVLVHRWLSEWSRQAATRRLRASATQAATGRQGLRAAEAELASDVVDLQFVQEGSRLYAPSEPAAETTVCPFKGLAFFEAVDADYFFGRERLVAELVARLVGASFLAVVGPSGGGKSSVVRAGLLPALASGVVPGSERWSQLVMRPGDHPLAELRRALPAASAATPRELVLKAGEHVADGERLVLVVDQFEELFTACRDEQERTLFVEALVAGARESRGGLVLVVAMRGDVYGRFAIYPELAALLGANHVLVGPMAEEELRRAVDLPARRAGLNVEPELAAALVASVVDEPGGLPLLSTTLLELWQRRDGRTMTLASYRETGGVQGAVARLAEAAYGRLSGERKRLARAMLLRLAGPIVGETVVRRRVPLAELDVEHDEDVARVLAVLTDARLLTVSDGFVEVAHEALLREWPRLRGWLEEDVQGRRLHLHLAGAAREWAERGKDTADLYRGARLASTLDWTAEHQLELNQLEEQFLEQSRAASQREAERARRINRRLRGSLAGVAIFLVVALVGGGLALVQRGQVAREANRAQAGRLGALAQTEDELDRSLLLARQAVALDDSLDRRGELLAALLRTPAATGVMRADLDGIGPLSLSADGRLLAMGDYGGRMEVFDVRTRRPIPGTFRTQAEVNDLELSPDGALLAVATQGLVELWDVRSARLRHELRTGRTGIGVEFSADGRTLVALSIEGDPESGAAAAFLTSWKVDSGGRLDGPVRVSSHGGDALTATPDGAHLVIANGHEVVVAAAATLRPVRRVRREPERNRAGPAALSPTDGRTLAVGWEKGEVELIDLVTGRRRRWTGRHDAFVVAIAFSPDGATLATGGADRKVKVWDVASGQLRETFEGHEGRFAGLRFSPDGGAIYAAGSRSVIVWDLEGSGRLGRPFPFASGPTPPTFAVSPDGSLIATPDGNQADHVALRDLRAPKQVRRSLAPGIGRIFAIAFGPDGRSLALGGERSDSAPVLVDVASGRITRRMTGGHDGGFVTLAFDPEGQRLLTGGNDRRAIVWDAATGQRILELRQPGDDEFNETPAAWSPDGTMVATAGGAGKVVVWRVSDREQVATLPADPRWVSSVAFSPDGSMIAAGGLVERQTTLWDVDTGKLVGRLPHPTYIVKVGFDPGGRTLATAAADGTVRLWDVASLRQVGLAFPAPENWSAVGFDPGGNHLVVLYENGTGLVWDVDPDRWKERACAVASRSLTREEWEELLPGRRYQPACR